MIYNENGVILNGQSVLEMWYNTGDNKLDQILDESFSDLAKGAKKTVQMILRKMIDLIQTAIEKISRIPHTKIIKFLKQYEGMDALPFELNIDMEDQKILTSEGYKSGNILTNFQNACEALNNNHSLSLDEIKEKLYEGNTKEKWFGR